MPKRSNDFQAVIYFLQKELADGAVVTESAELIDRITGQKREVDIVIRGTVAGHDVVVGIECRDHQRKQSVEWVEQAHTKLADLPIDRRVLIARTGFTKPALQKAHFFGITALGLEQAASVAGARGVLHPEALQLLKSELAIERVILMVRGGDDDGRPVAAMPDNIIFRLDGEEAGVMRPAVHEVLTSPHILARILELPPVTDPSERYVVDWDRPRIRANDPVLSPAYVRWEETGDLHLVERIRCVLKGRVHGSTIPLNHGAVGGARVAWGKVKLGTDEALLVIPDSTSSKTAWLRTSEGDIELDLRGGANYSSQA